MDLQPASLDMWDDKYRLKDKKGDIIDETLEDTFVRIAKALSSVEKKDLQEKYFHLFLQAMKDGAIPAGRIVSNAGAWKYKPSTSLINCTVSKIITDDMEGILFALYEAGLTLKSGAGIGYEFSTLRPKGAFVHGPGASTSGPLSFMEPYDAMCRTISSAGGRRGAQMATFDIGHPDIKDFILVKRKDGTLRQFNLSCLITQDFMQAVEDKTDWQLAFPVKKSEFETLETTKIVWRQLPLADDDYVVNEENLVACKIYKTIEAEKLWDLIMQSTYDYAEPGFILVDKYNEMNNTYFCEVIRATNPCSVEGTLVNTPYGYKRVEDFKEGDLISTVRGIEPIDVIEVHEDIPVFKVTFSDGGFQLVTISHRFHVLKKGEESKKIKDIPLNEVMIGDYVRVHPGILEEKGNTQDYIMGLRRGVLLGDGCFTDKILETNGLKIATNQRDIEYNNKVKSVFEQDKFAFFGKNNISKKSKSMSLSILNGRDVINKLGLTPALSYEKTFDVTKVTNREEVIGILDGLIATDGDVNMRTNHIQVRITTSSEQLAYDIRRLYLLLGCHARITNDFRDDGGAIEGRKIIRKHRRFVVNISGSSIATFIKYSRLNELHPEKGKKLQEAVDHWLLTGNTWKTAITSIEPCGTGKVFDLYCKGSDTWITSGYVQRGCGEQGLPPGGACLLGSINLARFILNAFTDRAEFDWVKYEEVVAIFTRMLDNVVELNGLPLERQREEILRKRRHGMGYTGLGSALVMLGIPYGSPKSIEFTEQVTKVLAIKGFEVGIELAKEKGPAPIMEEEFEIKEWIKERLLNMDTPYLTEKELESYGKTAPGKVLMAYGSKYLEQFPVHIREGIAEHGCRFTHHSSIAPAGTISLSLGNNCSNGIEPSFSHEYSRNVIRKGKKTKAKVDVCSFELLEYQRLINANASPNSESEENKLPACFIDAGDINPKQHIDIQAAAQKWIDSSISKTINIPTDFPFEEFKDIYKYAYKKGLKGCTVFRFNPENFQGVLVKDKDLENTIYKFTLKNGEEVIVKGNEQIEYDGELHTAANLFDAIKEGYYGEL